MISVSAVLIVLAVSQVPTPFLAPAYPWQNGVAVPIPPNPERIGQQFLSTLGVPATIAVFVRPDVPDSAIPAYDQVDVGFYTLPYDTGRLVVPLQVRRTRGQEAIKGYLVYRYTFWGGQTRWHYVRI